MLLLFRASLLLSEEYHQEYENVIEQVKRHDTFNNLGTEFVVKELNDDLDVRGLEHFFVVLKNQFLKEIQTFCRVYDPVGIYWFYFDGVGKCILIIFFFFHSPWILQLSFFDIDGL